MSNLKRNILYNIAYQILSLIVPLITAPYISRVLGTYGMGLYGYTYSIAHYFVLFCMLGVLNYGNREISIINGNQQALSEKFWSIYFNQLIFGVMSLIVYFSFVSVYVENDRFIYNLQSLYIISGLMDISWFYFGIERFKITTAVSAANKLLTTILIFILVKESSDLWIYTLIISGGTLLNNLAYWLLINKYTVGIKWKMKAVLSHLKPLLILFIPVIAVNIYKYIDKIMLGAMVDVNEVGIFEAAEKLTNIPVCFIAAIGTVMLPRVSKLLGNQDIKNVLRYNSLSLNLVMFLSCGMAFGLVGIATVFVPLFYGDAFVKASEVLIFLSPCLLFVSWANVIRTQYLLPNRKDILFCVSVIAGALVNVIANIILVPTYGAEGAAISTLIAEVIVCSVQTGVAYRKMRIISSLKSSSIYILLGLIMCIIIKQIHNDSALMTVILRIITGLVIYSLLSSYFIKKILIQHNIISKRLNE